MTSLFNDSLTNESVSGSLFDNKVTNAMKTDAEVRSDAMSLLRGELGLVDAERFLSLVQREQFDYTEWRKDKWLTSTVTELAEQARELRKQRQS